MADYYEAELEINDFSQNVLFLGFFVFFLFFILIFNFLCLQWGGKTKVQVSKAMAGDVLGFFLHLKLVDLGFHLCYKFYDWSVSLIFTSRFLFVGWLGLSAWALMLFSSKFVFKHFHICICIMISLFVGLFPFHSDFLASIQIQAVTHSGDSSIIL